MLLIINAMRTSRPREWVLAAVKDFRIKFRDDYIAGVKGGGWF
jgi:hypothetical protein